MRMVSRALLPGSRSALGQTHGRGTTRTGTPQRTPAHMLCMMQVCTIRRCCGAASLLLTTGQDPDPPPQLCYLCEGCSATSSALFQFGSWRQLVRPPSSSTDQQRTEETSLQRAEAHFGIAKRPLPISPVLPSSVTNAWTSEIHAHIITP